MNRMQTITGITAIVLGLTGCTKDATQTPAEQSKSFREEYNTGNSATNPYNDVQTIEGSIVKVQPSSLAFKQGVAAANHEFIYVILQERTGTLHTLIYPQSRPILERQAVIKYRGLPNNAITANTLINLLIEPKEGANFYTTDDDILIEAEGIITRDGIKYR